MVTLGKNMRSVSIVSVGCTPFKDFEEHPETQGIGEGEAFGYAALEAIADAGLPLNDDVLADGLLAGRTDNLI